MSIDKFVIWGVGERGKIITGFLHEYQILAYIDSDISKQGAYYLNHPIISFEEYLENFNDYFIIVTPVNEEQILNKLHDHHIKKYFRMSQLPSEMQGYGDVKFLENIEIPVTNMGNNIILGTTLYSCMLYKKIKDMGYKNVYLLENPEDERISLIRENFEFDTISQINEEDILICTIATEISKNNCKAKKTVDLFDVSDLLPQYYNRDIEAFRNKHYSERCFIVATGPSLKQEDLKILSKNNEICFGVNRVFYVDEKIWKPQYYVFLDRLGMKEYWDDIAAYDVDNKFIGDSYWKNVAYKGEMHVIHAVTGHSFKIPPKFSENLERKVYTYATVTYAAIQIAVYMGFSTIYLLGVDCNYSNKRNYFFQEEKRDIYNHYEDRMLMAYEIAENYAKSHNIKIINASRGGNLEVFDRIDFDKIFI